MRMKSLITLFLIKVRVVNKFAGIHRGPARRYPTLAMLLLKILIPLLKSVMDGVD